MEEIIKRVTTYYLAHYTNGQVWHIGSCQNTNEKRQALNNPKFIHFEDLGNFAGEIDNIIEEIQNNRNNVFENDIEIENNEDQAENNGFLYVYVAN